MDDWDPTAESSLLQPNVPLSSRFSRSCSPGLLQGFFTGDAILTMPPAYSPAPLPFI